MELWRKFIRLFELSLSKEGLAPASPPAGGGGQVYDPLPRKLSTEQ